MGTITERLGKRGKSYKVQVRRQGHEPQTATFRTKAAAERWMRSIETAQEEGRFVTQKPAQKTTLLAALQRYELHVTPTKQSAEKEVSIIRKWKAHKLAHRALASLKSSDFALARDEWLQTNKPSSVVRYMALVSNVFTVARKEWGFEGLPNPLLDVVKPAVSDARTRVVRDIELSAPDVGEEDDDDAEPVERKELVSEIEHIASATRSKWLPLAMEFAIETAMRRSELTALLWDHVDLSKRIAHLPKTKNGHARDVPLSPRAIGVLQRIERAADPRVFPVRADALTRAFTRAMERAREEYVVRQKRKGARVEAQFLIGLRFHDLRHEATTRLARIFEMHELAKITGHKSSKMLLRYYHPRAQDLALKFPDVSSDS